MLTITPPKISIFVVEMKNCSVKTPSDSDVHFRKEVTSSPCERRVFRT